MDTRRGVVSIKQNQNNFKFYTCTAIGHRAQRELT